MHDTLIIKAFRKIIEYEKDDARKLILVKLLNAWGKWVNYINHTNSVMDKHNMLWLFIFPWFVLRNIKASKLEKTVFRCLNDLVEYDKKIIIYLLAGDDRC